MLEIQEVNVRTCTSKLTDTAIDAAGILALTLITEKGSPVTDVLERLPRRHLPEGAGPWCILHFVYYHHVLNPYPRRGRDDRHYRPSLASLPVFV